MALDKLASCLPGFAEGVVVVLGNVATEMEIGVGLEVGEGELDAVEAGVADGFDLLVKRVFGEADGTGGEGERHCALLYLDLDLKIGLN